MDDITAVDVAVDRYQAHIAEKFADPDAGLVPRLDQRVVFRSPELEDDKRTVPLHSGLQTEFGPGLAMVDPAEQGLLDGKTYPQDVVLFCFQGSEKILYFFRDLVYGGIPQFVDNTVFFEFLAS